MSRNGKQQAYQAQSVRSKKTLYPNDADIIEAEYEEVVERPKSSASTHKPYQAKASGSSGAARPDGTDKSTAAKALVIVSVFGKRALKQIKAVDWSKHSGRVLGVLRFVLAEIWSYFSMLMGAIHESIAPQYRSFVYIAIALIIMVTPLGFMLFMPDAEVIPSDSLGYDVPISQQERSIPVDSNLAAFFSPTVHYWSADIERWSDTTGFDSNYLAMLVQLESCGNPNYANGERVGLFAVPQSEFAANESWQDVDINAKRAIERLERGLNLSRGNYDMALAYFHGGDIVLQSDFTRWTQPMRDYFIFGRRIYQDAQSGASYSDSLNQWLAAGGGALCQQASMTING